MYGQKYDGALRTALKRPTPVLEVLENEVIKLALEIITNQSKIERGEPIDTRVQLVTERTTVNRVTASLWPWKLAI